MNVAVIFSPGAGQKQHFSTIGERLQQFFTGHKLFTCAESFGGDYLPGASICKVETTGGYVQTLGCITRALLDRQPELLVSVGGDGIASYIADAMLTAGSRVPMMGVAAGTANAGPIVCISADELENCDSDRWIHTAVSAIEVVSGEHVGYAVNDVVVGNSFLGTEGESVVYLSAEAMALYGKKEFITPSADICREDFQVYKNGVVAPRHVRKPGQIIASPLDLDRLEGRAIYGALCSAAYTPCKGALGLTEQVMISEEAQNAGFDSFCPMEHLLFGPGDEILLSGLSVDAHLILDGNPYIRTHDTIVLRYHPDLIPVAVPERKE